MLVEIFNKLSRGEICLANFIHPCKWGESGKLFPAKKLTKTALAAKVANFFSNGFWFWFDERSNNFSPFCFASPEIIGDEFGNRRTDRHTDRQTNSLTPYTGVGGFFSFS